MALKTLFSSRPICFLALAAICFLPSCKESSETVTAPVVPAHEVRMGPEGLLRGGQPYFIKGGTNIACWKQLERLARIVREIDPGHPPSPPLSTSAKKRWMA